MVARNLTLRALAQAAGCSHQMIHFLAHGKKRCTKALAERIAEALGVAVLDLFYDPFRVLPADVRKRNHDAGSYRPARERPVPGADTTREERR